KTWRVSASQSSSTSSHRIRHHHTRRDHPRRTGYFSTLASPMPYKDPSKQRAARRESYARRMRLIEALKSGPCKDCQTCYDRECMDFDHVRGRKLFRIGGCGVLTTMVRLKREIAKCDLVCA